MPPAPPAPPIDWNATRAAYLDRFGTLVDVRQTADDTGPGFWILCFQNAARPAAPFVLATFGAPDRDLYLASMIPSHGMSVALERAALKAPPTPELPALLRFRTARTAFAGLLALPEEEEQGSFTVRGADGSPRPVYRVVPITMGERELASRSPAAALDQVRAAGALVADPLRDCTRDPDDTRWFRVWWAPANIRRMRRGQEELDHDLAGLRAHGAAREIIAERERWVELARVSLTHYEARLPAVPTDADRMVVMTTGPMDQRYVATINAAVERGTDALADDPLEADVIAQLTEILALIITSHPRVRPLVDAVVLGRDDSERDRPEAAEVGQRVLDAIEVIAAHHPDQDRATLAKRARDALAHPFNPTDPGGEDETVADCWLWFNSVNGMYDGIFSRLAPIRRGLRLAFFAWPTAPDDLEGATPFERLCRISERYAVMLTSGYFAPISGDPNGHLQ